MSVEVEGRIPGYAGYIPGKNNHIIGKRYTEATRRANECTNTLTKSYNPSNLEALVDSRPQGRNFLYAQCIPQGPAQEVQPCKAHVGKRRPILSNPGLGVDFRTMKTLIGTAEGYTLPTHKSASLPALPFHQKKLQTRKMYNEKVETIDDGHVPGYTGHQHAGQHVYAKSYGSTTKLLGTVKADSASLRSSLLNDYGEIRPVGVVLEEKHRIPGYAGYIPGKDNHIYAKTYGKSTDLAPNATTILSEGGNASTISDLVDSRPQGRIDLYSEAAANQIPQTNEKLQIHVSKGRVDVSTLSRGKDHKLREPITQDNASVMEGSHKIVGYTGHVHGHQHVYAKSFGKMTRDLNGGKNLQNPHTPDDLLYYRDERPQQKV